MSNDPSEAGDFYRALFGGGPLCSQRVPPEHVEGFVRGFLLRAQRADSIAEGDPEEAETWRARARRNRAIAWAFEPEDQVWFTVDPKSHPEVRVGEAALVVVRGGAVISRESLGLF